VFKDCFWYWLKAKIETNRFKFLLFQPIVKCEYYAVFKLTAEGPLGPSSTSKVKA
jgi:hypothetical protein